MLQRSNSKLSKEEAGYSKGKPNAHCAICDNYYENRCDIVTGFIQPNMWCKYFEKEEHLMPESDTRTIQLVRHGATKLNNDDVSVDRIRGWKNIPLSKDGYDEAIRLGDQLRKNPPNAIVSSDLERAYETAGVISRLTKSPLVESTKAFRPWNVGDYAGKITSEALPILREYVKTPNKAIPGGESFNSFRKRFFNGLLDALDANRGIIAVVTHHRGERLLNAWAKGRYREDGSIDISEFNKKGEHTGAVNMFPIPLAALRSVVSHD